MLIYRNFQIISFFFFFEKKKVYLRVSLAVDKPIYEIRGTVVYKTNDDGDCRHEIIHLVKKQLPNYVQIEICPEGSSQYACNVIIETSKCIEDGVKYYIIIYYLFFLFDLYSNIINQCPL